MKNPIHLYKIASPPQGLRRWTLPEFVSYAATAPSGPTPNAMPGGGNYFNWTRVDYSQNAVVDFSGLAGVYIESLSALQEQCAILIQSPTQATVRFDALNDITPAVLQSLVAAVGGPGPSLCGAVITPSTDSSGLTTVVGLLAAAIVDVGMPPAYGSVTGVSNFSDAFGAAPSGYFGRYVSLT
jgi:hypothetical protein